MRHPLEVHNGREHDPVVAPVTWALHQQSCCHNTSCQQGRNKHPTQNMTVLWLCRSDSPDPSFQSRTTAHLAAVNQRNGWAATNKSDRVLSCQYAGTDQAFAIGPHVPLAAADKGLVAGEFPQHTHLAAPDVIGRVPKQQRAQGFQQKLAFHVALPEVLQFMRNAQPQIRGIFSQCCRQNDITGPEAARRKGNLAAVAKADLKATDPFPDISVLENTAQAGNRNCDLYHRHGSTKNQNRQRSLGPQAGLGHQVTHQIFAQAQNALEPGGAHVDVALKILRHQHVRQSRRLGHNISRQRDNEERGQSQQKRHAVEQAQLRAKCRAQMASGQNGAGTKPKGNPSKEQ
mmetsp:Transcript_24287/g.31643  ORF Transcript_24287/g.31643 Transcript_24287/m.31643 type:complete len:345 (+) Transcript_24287:206-1240(+)